MIEAKVVFDGEEILCNGFEIEISMYEDYDKFYVVGEKIFSGLEQAINYCMEQGKMNTELSGTSLEKVTAIHAEMLKTNSYCYFELAYTRQAEWMLFICSNSREQDPNRKILLKGQGFTPEEACTDALAKYMLEQGE